MSVVMHSKLNTIENGTGRPICLAHTITEIVVSTVTCTPHKLTAVTRHTKYPQ